MIVSSVFVMGVLWLAAESAFTFPCPSVRATAIPAESKTEGEGYCTLGLDISLFGGFFVGVRTYCPEFTFVYPAHGKCLGKESPGTYCTVMGESPVRLIRRRCQGVNLLVARVPIPTCAEVENQTIGSVENAVTRMCPIVESDPPSPDTPR